MEINRETLICNPTGFSEEDKLKIGCLKFSKFFPVGLLGQNTPKFYKFVKGTDTLVTDYYYKIKYPNNVDIRPISYVQVYDTLVLGDYPYTCMMKKNGCNVNIHASNWDLLSEKNKILFTLATDNPECVCGKTLYSQRKNLVLLISTDFAKDAKYKSLYNMVNKKIIIPLLEMDITKVECSSEAIEKFLYNDGLEKVSLESFNNLQENINNRVLEILKS